MDQKKPPERGAFFLTFSNNGVECSMEVYILRGVSGSGKSTVAKSLAEGRDAVICCADDYFETENGYRFNPSKLHDAHQECWYKFRDALDRGVKTIIVANTNTSDNEYLRYLEMAKFYKYQVFLLVVENHHGNSSIHNVPAATLERQRDKLKNSIKL